jgi:hypothetical protein
MLVLRTLVQAFALAALGSACGSAAMRLDGSDTAIPATSPAGTQSDAIPATSPTGTQSDAGPAIQPTGTAAPSLGLQFNGSVSFLRGQ